MDPRKEKQTILIIPMIYPPGIRRKQEANKKSAGFFGKMKHYIVKTSHVFSCMWKPHVRVMVVACQKQPNKTFNK
jgi:hypothetical protein